MREGKGRHYLPILFNFFLGIELTLGYRAEIVRLTPPPPLLQAFLALAGQIQSSNIVIAVCKPATTTTELEY